MGHGKFDKISHSDDRLYGSRKLLLCGFPSKAQPKFAAVLKMAGLTDVPVVWAGEDQSPMVLLDLFVLDDGNGTGKSSPLPRAVIVSGITENELHRLMMICKKTGMKKPLWAVLTPNSEKWRLGRLLNELQKEQKAMKKRS